MEGLEKKLAGLEKVNDSNVKNAILRDSPFNRLAKDWELYLGGQFGESTLTRSGYRYNPATGELLLDYHHFFQTFTSLINIVGTHATKLKEGSYDSIGEEIQAGRSSVAEDIENMCGYLKEILDKYDEKKLDINGKTLNIANNIMYDDLRLLGMKAVLVGNALIERVKAPQSEQAKRSLIMEIEDLMQFYNKIKAEYEKGKRILGN